MNPVDAPSLSHLDETGQARMVDVGDKAVTARVAVCEALVTLSPSAFGLLADHAIAKGDVLNTARVAGILAAKRCAELIPLCHTLPLSFAGVDFALEPGANQVRITATCRSDHKTGVEMEAMTACSVAALTIYDMCKAADKGIVVQAVRLLYKSGGKSGDWLAPGLTEPPPAAFAAGAVTRAAAPGQAAPGAPRASVLREPAAAAGVSSAAAVRPLRAEAAKPSEGAGPGEPSAQTAWTGASAASVPPAAPAQASVNLVFFARVAEQVGARAQAWPWPSPATGADLLAQLGERYPQIQPVSRLKLAVNQQHARADTRIAPGDEVAVFEPVTGG